MVAISHIVGSRTKFHAHFNQTMAGRRLLPTPLRAVGMHGEPAGIGHGLVFIAPHLLLQLGQPNQGERAEQGVGRVLRQHLEARTEVRPHLLTSMVKRQEPVGMGVAPRVEVFFSGLRRRGHDRGSGCFLSTSNARGPCMRAATVSGRRVLQPWWRTRGSPDRKGPSRASLSSLSLSSSSSHCQRS